jgi:hypothetical protein
MPKRSNAFQAMVRAVREHYAGQAVQVTESKVFHDVDGREREVDIVVEGVLAGERIVLSYEVSDRGRRRDVTYVEGLIKKHETLPTHRLILVSRSGFTAGALRAVEREAGRVAAITMEVHDAGNQPPIIKKLFKDEWKCTPTRCRAVVSTPQGIRGETDYLQPSTSIHDADGNILGSLMQLINEILQLKDVGEAFGIMAHRRDDKGAVTHFSTQLPISPCGYFFYRKERGALNQIHHVIIEGEFKISPTEIVFTPQRLGDDVFLAAEGTIAGQEAIWVAFPNFEDLSLKVFWQTTGTPGPPPPPPEFRPTIFPCLEQIDLAPLLAYAANPDPSEE